MWNVWWDRILSGVRLFVLSFLVQPLITGTGCYDEPQGYPGGNEDDERGEYEAKSCSAGVSFELSQQFLIYFIKCVMSGWKW